MTKKEYANEIVNIIKKNHPEYTVEASDTMKNNGVIYTGISILKEGSSIAPRIYIDDMYDKGKSIIDAADEVMEIYNDNNTIPFDFNPDDFMDWNKVSSHIYARLVSKKIENTADRPYREFLDLVITYYVEVSDGAFVAVKTNLLDSWGVTEGVLYETAMKNTKRDKPCYGRPMFDVLCELASPETLDDLGVIENDKLYVYCNKGKTYGAIAMAIADFGDKPRYILPSSIHEVLSVAAESDGEPVDVDNLKTMVKEVNDNEVEPAERLSYSVYYWDGKEMSIA